MSFFDEIDKTEFQKIEKKVMQKIEQTNSEENLEPDWDELIKDEEIPGIIDEEYLLNDISNDYMENEEDIYNNNNDDEIEIIVTENEEDEILEQTDTTEQKIESIHSDKDNKVIEQKLSDSDTENFKMEISKQKESKKNNTNIDNRTIVSEKTIINGNIDINENIVIAGTINGDINVKEAAEVLICENGIIHGNIIGCGCINICGSVTGDISGDVIVLNNTKIFGKVEAQRNIHISKDSVIIGNVFAKNINIAGAIEGDINIKGQAILEKTAIVKGNIQSKAVQINTGAMIHGVFTQSYTDDNPIEFFDKIKKENKI